MVASLITALLSLSMVSDWLRRHAIDTIEGEMWPEAMQRRWVSWGTCWPVGANGMPRFDRPDITFKHILIRLPSWEFLPERAWGRAGDSVWHQRCLYKFGSSPWRAISIVFAP